MQNICISHMHGKHIGHFRRVSFFFAAAPTIFVLLCVFQPNIFNFAFHFRAFSRLVRTEYEHLFCLCLNVSVQIVILVFSLLK